MNDTKQGRTWLITATSSGLGRAFAQAALQAGDVVVATARNPAAIRELVAAHPGRAYARALDVTDREAVFRVFDEAVSLVGELDVFVNCAGVGLHAALEEASEAECRAMIDTNLFGALWTSQAAAAHMRPSGHGHIIQVSSAAGSVGFPMVGLYAAAKFGLEGMTECLALELAPFAVKVTIVAPSDFRTGFRSVAGKPSQPIDAYQATFAPNLDEMSDRHNGTEAGDPALAAKALLELVANQAPPTRLLLGNMAFERVTAAARRRIAEAELYEAVSRSADGPADE